MLVEYGFNATEDQSAASIADWLKDNAIPRGDEYAYWRNSLPQRLAILHDEDFRFFVTTATQVVTRVRLTEAKTVAPGALWSEEALPPETLLHAPVVAKSASDGSWRPQECLEQAVSTVGRRLTLGGTESIGRGSVALRWLKGGC